MTPVHPNAPAKMFRALNALAAAGCFASLAVAYFFMEKYLLLEPCPLCILDRFVVAAMGLVFLAMALRDSRGKTAWAGMLANCVFLAAGFVFAGRHIWLQNRPPEETASCLSDAPAAEDFIELIRLAFDANADCGAIIWEDPIFALTIPEQVLVMFIGFAVLLAAQVVNLRWMPEPESDPPPASDSPSEPQSESESKAGGASS